MYLFFIMYTKYKKLAYLINLPRLRCKHPRAPRPRLSRTGRRHWPTPCPRPGLLAWSRRLICSGKQRWIVSLDLYNYLRDGSAGSWGREMFGEDVTVHILLLAPRGAHRESMQVLCYFCINLEKIHFYLDSANFIWRSVTTLSASSLR